MSSVIWTGLCLLLQCVSYGWASRQESFMMPGCYHTEPSLRRPGGNFQNASRYSLSLDQVSVDYRALDQSLIAYVQWCSPRMGSMMRYL